MQDVRQKDQRFNAMEFWEIDKIFQHVVDRKITDLYSVGTSQAFERIASWLFDDVRREVWYDGVMNLQVNHRKKRQIQFTGNMIVCSGAKAKSRSWDEEFICRMTDKTSTKEGLWVSMDIGEYYAEGNLSEGYLDSGANQQTESSQAAQADA